MAVYATTESGSVFNITPGRRYPTRPGDSDGEFRITTDAGSEIYCLWNGCAHLGGGSWQRIEEDERVTLKPGDYVSTEGMTEDQYRDVARAFANAGCPRFGGDAAGKGRGDYLEWFHDELVSTHFVEPGARHLTPSQVIGATNAGGEAQDTLTGALKYACDELDTARQHEAKAAEHRANHDGAMEHVRDMLPDGWRLVRDGIPADVYRSFEDQTRRMMREADMTDPANWREGDVFEVTRSGAYCADVKKGDLVALQEAGGSFFTSQGTGLSWSLEPDSVRFHHRPT